MVPVTEEVKRVVESKFGGHKVLVVGDLMLDAYLWGEVSRISPEAPVPVLKLNRRTVTPGGSANVLLNLVGLGLQAVAAGFLGDDESGRDLTRLLNDAGVSSAATVVLSDRPTTTKTRVVSGHHQLVRIDDEGNGPIPEAGLQRLMIAIQAEINKNVDAIILSDYAKGVLTDEICQWTIREARSRGIPILVDPKGKRFEKYRGATTLTPNLKEFEIAGGLDHDLDGEAFAAAVSSFREALQLDYMVVTCGDKGIKYSDGNRLFHHSAIARQVFDVSGAGDTVIATLAASVAAGIDFDSAIHLANLAAGVVVGKVGTTPIRLPELVSEIRESDQLDHSRNVFQAEDLARRVAEWKEQGDRIVFTNGCFDLLHVGHMTILAKARQLGTRLIVGLNTDRSVRALKGPTRPINNEHDRAVVLSGLSSVDAVVHFDEDTPIELIRKLRPDIIVKGGDYKEEDVVGGDLVKSWGGRVAIIPLVDGKSTTGMISRSQAKG